MVGASRDDALLELAHELPALRKLPGFPDADDEAILGRSLPPHYTPCPNPFIKQFATGGDETPGYVREPFASDTREGRGDPIYRGHIYHTKVPPLAIARYIEHFAPEGGLVFDGFCGSGMTEEAARMTGRRAILVDLSPAATAIAAAYCVPCDPEELAAGFDTVLRRLQEECGRLYELEDGRGIEYVIWAEVYRCPNCNTEAPFSEYGFDFEDRSRADEATCPGCGQALNARRLARCVDDSDKVREAPVRTKHRGQRRDHDLSPPDLALIERIEGMPIPYWHPDGPMMGRETGKDSWGDMWRRGYHQGVRRVSDFYTKRTLWALAAALQFARELDTDPAVGHAVQQTIVNASINLTKMRRAYQGPIPLVLYLPRMRRESNVLKVLEARFRRGMEAARQLPTGGEVIISTQSSTCLPNIPDDCADYVFTDPPFGQNIIYSEVNFLWESWLGITTAAEHEAIVSKYQKKGVDEYEGLMSACFEEFRRILKPEHWMTVEFHNSSNDIWSAIQGALESSGFVVEDARILDKGQPSFKQASTENAVQQDLVISARNPQKRRRLRNSTQSKDGDAWEFVQARLTSLEAEEEAPGSPERTDRVLYSRMVQAFLREGLRVPISAAEFYRELAQRFHQRDGAYCLPPPDAP